MPQYTLNKKTFSGNSKVYDGTLAGMIIALAQFQANMVAAQVATLTDNGGGAANGTIEAIPVLANYAALAGDGVAKADAENAFGTVLNALSEVIYQINRVAAVVPAFPALVDNTGGAAATGTVAAITQAVATAGGSFVSATGAIPVYEDLVSAILQAAVFVNRLADAVGVAEIVLPEGVIPTYSNTFSAISLLTGASPSGADTTNANATLSHVAFNAALVWMANAIKELTTTLHAIGTFTPSVQVIVQ